MSSSARPEPAHASGGPLPYVTAPARMARSGPPPVFEVDPGDGAAAYYAVEVATSPALLAASAEPARTPSTYCASWQDTGLLASTSFALPEAAWDLMRSGSQLAYRAWLSTDPADWAGVVVTTADDRGRPARRGPGGRHRRPHTADDGDG